ncbi:hypothetical protein LDENG_00284380, partial [Lucifuga dentata]
SNLREAQLASSSLIQPAGARQKSKELTIRISVEPLSEQKPCQQTLTKERRHLSRSVHSAILWRKVESIRSAQISGVCLDARLARQRATPTLMPIKAKALSGMKKPSWFIWRTPRNTFQGQR